MIPVNISPDLFGEYQAEIFDPATKRAEIIPLSQIEANDPDVPDAIRIMLLKRAVIKLRQCQLDYIDFLTKYREVKKQTKLTIKEVNSHFKTGLYLLNGLRDLPSVAANIYEDLLPWLAMFGPDKPVYKQLLQCLGNECIEYSADHQLNDENSKNVTHWKYAVCPFLDNKERTDM